MAEVGPDPTLFALFGEGFLAITFDQAATAERYQGIVPLEGASIGEAAEHYFEQSEQISSLIKLSARHDAEAGCVAGGLLLQHLPEGEVGRDRLHVRLNNPEWDHAHTIASTLKDEELTDPAHSLETLAWRLFHEDEVRVEPGVTFRAVADAAPAISPACSRSFPNPNGRTWQTKAAMSSSIVPSARAFSRFRSKRFRRIVDAATAMERCNLTPSG